MNAQRTVTTLAIAQALGLSGAPLVVMVGGVVGRELAPLPALATLPLAAMVVGTALTAAPAALLMQSIGRRRGLTMGAVLGALGATAAAVAITLASFAGFCFGTLLIGGSIAFVMQYRFAAAEAAGPAAARAVAFVLAGGIAAGLLGPELGRRARGLLDVPWAGSFVALAVVFGILALVLLAGLERGAPPPVVKTRRSASFGLLRDPAFFVAAAAGVTAYAVMSLVMTAAPLAMHGAGFDVDATAIVIQAHVVAMYGPSLIAGPLAARYGLGRLMAVGIAGLAICAGVGLTAHGLPAWIAALVLLGIGWNLLFLGGTVALARAFPGEERFRAQALNDLLVFGTQAIASLSSGLLLANGGWAVVNLVALAPLALMAMLLITRMNAVRPRPAPS